MKRLGTLVLLVAAACEHSGAGKLGLIVPLTGNTGPNSATFARLNG